MTLPMGKLYKDMSSKNPKFGFLPRMAQASKGQIGALNAESFCERCLSCIYRMSHDRRKHTAVQRGSGDAYCPAHERGLHIMEYMRARRPKLSQQRLNQTVVSRQ